MDNLNFQINHDTIQEVMWALWHLGIVWMWSVFPWAAELRQCTAFRTRVSWRQLRLDKSSWWSPWLNPGGFIRRGRRPEETHTHPGLLCLWLRLVVYGHTWLRVPSRLWMGPVLVFPICVRTWQRQAALTLTRPLRLWDFKIDMLCIYFPFSSASNPKP